MESDRMVVESEDEIDGDRAGGNPSGMTMDAAESATTPLNVEESLTGSDEKKAEGTGREDQGAAENLKSAVAGASSSEGESLEGGRGAEMPVEPEKPAEPEKLVEPEKAVQPGRSGGKKAPRSKREGDKPAPTRIMTRGRGNAEKPMEPPEKLAPVTQSLPWSETKVVSSGITGKSPAKRSPERREGEGSSGLQKGKRVKRPGSPLSDIEEEEGSSPRPVKRRRQSPPQAKSRVFDPPAPWSSKKRRRRRA
jgi:hypothetical protein